MSSRNPYSPTKARSNASRRVKGHANSLCSSCLSSKDGEHGCQGISCLDLASVLLFLNLPHYTTATNQRTLTRLTPYPPHILTMAAVLALPKISHPALLSPLGLPTPPPSPTSPITTTHITPTKPNVSYALLRAHHASALKYTIAKLRWEQINNGYLRNEDAWQKHNRMIQKLETELTNVEEAQKGLDRFPNCFAPIAFPKQHGPASKEAFDANLKAEKQKQLELDAKLDAAFPWIKQVYIGPMTRHDARKNKMLREGLAEGELDDEDLDMLLPSENMRRLLEFGPKGDQKPSPAEGREKKVRKPYQEDRLDKERAKIAAYLEANPPKRPVPKPRIGPLTHDEWRASLPRFGPITKGEAMLPIQREHRQAILTWMRKSWQVWDEQAAAPMERLAKIGKVRLETEAKLRAREEKAEKEKAEKREEEREKAEKEKMEARREHARAEQRKKEGKEEQKKAEEGK